MKKTLRKLTLSKETLRSLEARGRGLGPVQMSCEQSCYDMSCEGGCGISEGATTEK